MPALNLGHTFHQLEQACLFFKGKGQLADIILKYFEMANNSGYVVYTSLTVCSILYVDMCKLTRPTLVSSPLC